MMGDTSPSNIPELAFFGNQVRNDFPEQGLPISGLHPSMPTSSTDLRPRPIPYFPPSDHHPSVSFRQDGYEERSHSTSGLAFRPYSGHSSLAEDHMHDDLPTYHEGEDHFGLQSMLEQEVGLLDPQMHRQQEDLPKHVKEIKSKKWKEAETLILLECMVGGCFNKGKQGAMHWNLIAEEINKKNIGGPLRSKEQCQNRFDTLLKAYNALQEYCETWKKEFCDVTENEKKPLRLATPLQKKHEVWYNHLCKICAQRSFVRGESHKRQRPNVDGIEVSKRVSSSLHSSPQNAPAFDVIGRSKSMDPSSRQDIVKKFNALNVALRYTFFNLFEVLSLIYIWKVGPFTLEVLCRMLAIVQDQNPLEIRKHIYDLQALELVKLYDLEEEEVAFGDCWIDKKWIVEYNLDAYKKLRMKLLSKNLLLNTFYKPSCSVVLPTNLCPLQQIRVLILFDCGELENVNLGDFPNLRGLEINECENLKVVIGWKDAKGLGWIYIRYCPSYCVPPDVQFLSSLKEFYFLSSLKEFYFVERRGQRIPWQLCDFSQCVQLRRLEICDDHDLMESMDFKALRVLEVLSFSGCIALSTIHGLSGLHTLMKLDVRCCKSLKTLPGLGCLKALTYLDMRWSGIIEIHGVEELHLLTWLDLSWCELLESLPPLGHLKALVHLNLSCSSIEEILGVEDLVSLETLICCESKLKQLPNLEHLRLLRILDIDDTPLFRMDPSRSFIGGYELIHSGSKEEGVFVDDVSEFEDFSSDED